MVAIRSRPNCVSLSKVSSSKAINFRTGEPVEHENLQPGAGRWPLFSEAALRAGFRSALTRAINQYAKSNELLKEKDPQITGDDVREGLTAVVSVQVPESGHTPVKV